MACWFSDRDSCPICTASLWAGGYEADTDSDPVSVPVTDECWCADSERGCTTSRRKDRCPPPSAIHLAHALALALVVPFGAFGHPSATAPWSLVSLLIFDLWQIVRYLRWAELGRRYFQNGVGDCDEKALGSTRLASPAPYMERNPGVR